MSFPKETLRLCKQGTTTQSPAEHLALPDPPRLSPSGSQPATGAGEGGAVSSGLPGYLNKDWGRDRSLLRELDAARRPGDGRGGRGLPPRPANSEQRGPFLPAPAGGEEQADQAGLSAGFGCRGV